MNANGSAGSNLLAAFPAKTLPPTIVSFFTGAPSEKSRSDSGNPVSRRSYRRSSLRVSRRHYFGKRRPRREEFSRELLSSPFLRHAAQAMQDRALKPLFVGSGNQHRDCNVSNKCSVTSGLAGAARERSYSMGVTSVCHPGGFDRHHCCTSGCTSARPCA